MAFKILGINSSFSRDEIKKVYKSLAKKYHPDISGEVTKFLNIKNAYEFLLKNETKKTINIPKAKPEVKKEKFIADFQSFNLLTNFLFALFIILGYKRINSNGYKFLKSKKGKLILITERYKKIFNFKLDSIQKTVSLKNKFTKVADNVFILSF